MVTLSGTTGMELIAVGLEPGDLLLESLQAAVKQHDIQNGAVVSGYGTLKSCVMHYVTHTGFPPTDQWYTLADKPMELLSINATIAQGKVHAHIVVSCGEKEVYGGHLEPGSEILYLGEVLLLKFATPLMTRRYDAARKITLLQGGA